VRVAENVEMLELAAMGTAIYLTLAWDKENLVLFDTGLPGQAGDIVKGIAAAGFTAKGITHIILTHQDIDHVGCALDLLKLAPGAKVLAHADEAPYIDGRKTPVKLAAMLANYESLPVDAKAWCDKMRAGFANNKIHIDQTLADGEIINICGGFEVIHTPGHTPGHICLLLKESGILVGGDAVNIANGQLTGPNPQLAFDAGLAARSFDKIEKLGIRAVISYHCGYLQIKGQVG